jgi:hypothetical protein
MKVLKMIKHQRDRFCFPRAFITLTYAKEKRKKANDWFAYTHEGNVAPISLMSGG